jgi:ubiquinone/menaquinone biosynthesis C-methylase UbiE
MEGIHMNDQDPAQTFDTSKSEAFAEKLLLALNYGALCLMMSIGHRTGLFDVMRRRPPATAGEIARAAGLNERYVAEWLGAMVTGGVIEVDSTSMHFRLPEEHAAFLTRAAGSDNMSVYAQYIGLLGTVEDDIIQCFRDGCGVPYDKFKRFHAVMAEDSGQSVLSALESHILLLVPGLTDRLARGIRVLDLGCGSGRILCRMAELFPASRFFGIDLSPEAIRDAQAEIQGKELTNVHFAVRDLSDFHEWAEEENFDLVTTFDAIHDQARPLNVLKGIYRTLKRDGVYLMQDIRGSSKVHNNVDHPLGTFLYAVSTMHCMTVSLSQGGEGLGAMWGEEKALDYLARAGFGSIKVNQLSHDIQNNWYVVRKGNSDDTP